MLFSSLATGLYGSLAVVSVAAAASSSVDALITQAIVSFSRGVGDAQVALALMKNATCIVSSSDNSTSGGEPAFINHVVAALVNDQAEGWFGIHADLTAAGETIDDYHCSLLTTTFGVVVDVNVAFLNELKNESPCQSQSDKHMLLAALMTEGEGFETLSDMENIALLRPRP